MIGSFRSSGQGRARCRPTDRLRAATDGRRRARPGGDGRRRPVFRLRTHDLLDHSRVPAEVVDADQPVGPSNRRRHRHAGASGSRRRRCARGRAAPSRAVRTSGRPGGASPARRSQAPRPGVRGDVDQLPPDRGGDRGGGLEARMAGRKRFLGVDRDRGSASSCVPFGMAYAFGLSDGASSFDANTMARRPSLRLSPFGCGCEPEACCLQS